MIKPISPKEAKKIYQTQTQIPDEVFKVVNELIISHYNDTVITIKQKDIIENVSKELNIDIIDFNMKFLDFESYYQKQGWKVDYNSPGYCESFPETFSFSTIK
ncbi:MAG: hypothetical protein PHC28_11695 [Flavobacterium sp.]|uniref:hypothetical protein n=1 Tax=Flavobacterium sp. TaxID=239 RepID=UPI0026376C43|nr:hypothetical protein [Flavobacterium sp.]MDD5151116.1 hypothetical protein [Flavobacterium sp.]